MYRSDVGAIGRGTAQSDAGVETGTDTEYEQNVDHVITSTWARGITGTFLGDYFGILMDHRVEGFPFNVLRDPMYVGSTMSFAATALW